MKPHATFKHKPEFNSVTAATEVLSYNLRERGGNNTKNDAENEEEANFSNNKQTQKMGEQFAPLLNIR